MDKPEPATGTKAYKETSDTRVKERLEAKECAVLSKAYFCALEDKCKTEFIKILKMLVVSKGCWSIWMHQFEDVPELKRMMLDCIQGTRKEFFE